MKKMSLLTVMVLVISYGLMNAQTNKGKVFLGLSSSLSFAGTGSDLMSLGYTTVTRKSDAKGYKEADPDEMTSFNVLPKVGYFVIDNLVVGLDLNMALSSTKDGDDYYEASQTLFAAGPFVRYYIPTSRVLPFVEFSGVFGTNTSKYDYSDNTMDDDEYKTSIMSIGGGVGIAAPLGDRVLFDVLAGYNSLTYKAKEDNKDNVRNVIGTLGIKIGITVLLGSN